MMELFEQILPCDTEKQYAFVSYSHKDGPYVWEDVIALQKKGYNIWIDRNVSPTAERSWNEATKNRIVSINCCAVLFYTSANSMISEPCLHELVSAHSEEARDTHMDQPVPVIKIDVQPIRDMARFNRDTQAKIKESALTAAEKTAKAGCLTKMMKLCFPDGGAAVRILSRNDQTRERDYYTELTDCLRKLEVDEFTADEQYRNCVSWLADKSLHTSALLGLQRCAEDNHLYASLMLAYLLKTGVCGKKDPGKADTILFFEQCSPASAGWPEMADRQKRLGRREEAAALYQTLGLTENRADAFLAACKMWMTMPRPNYLMARQCLLDARDRGSSEAPKLLQGLEAHKNKYNRKQ